MFGKLMNGYFYGKSGKGDFTPDDLPKNRWELFWAMLRVRLSALTRLNLMTIVVFLPYLLIILINSLNLITSWSTAISYGEALKSGTEISGEVYSDALLEVYGRYTVDGAFQLAQYTRDIGQACLWNALLLLIPAILITGPVEAGLAYVCRNWARDEHAFIWSDFKDAVKENWKQGLGISAITSVLPLVIYISWNFYGEMAASSLVFMVPQIIVAMLGFVWLLALTFFYPLMVSYKLSFLQLLKNGIALGIGCLPQTVGIRLIVLLPVLICCILLLFTGVGMYAIMILGVYYIVCGISLARFIFASFTNAVFDKYINSHIAGVKVNRGLSKETDEEDDEADPSEDNA